SSLAGSVQVNVAPAAASRLSIAAPTAVPINTLFTITVTAIDPFGNVAAGYRGMIHLFSSDRLATLRPNYTYQPSDNGSHDFRITLGTLGLQTVGAVDRNNKFITGRTTIQVVAATASVPVRPATGTLTPETSRGEFATTVSLESKAVKR